MPTAALIDGARRVLGAPVLLVGATILTLLITLPLGLVVHGSQHPAPPIAVSAADDGPDRGARLVTEVAGLGAAFFPAMVGVTALLATLPARLDVAAHPGVMAVLILLNLIAWAVISGGLLDRLARDRPTRGPGFFAACGLHAPRLFRLTVLATLVQLALLGIASRLFGGGWTTWADAAGATGGAPAVGLLLACGGALAAVGLLFDYARVRAVVEDRRSVLAALAAAWRFVMRRPVGCLTLYAVNGLVLLAATLAYVAVTPGAATTGLSPWPAFLIAQLSVVSRILCRLLFYSVEAAYFQSQLAHAGYVAAPTPVWPESPTAEALGRLE